MSATALQAAQAYGSSARLVEQAAKSKVGGGGAGDEAKGFTDLLNQAVSSVTETGTAAETKATELASGRADIIDLVTAVAETEMAVATMVTVRDRVISAYQEIINMPI